MDSHPKRPTAAVRRKVFLDPRYIRTRPCGGKCSTPNYTRVINKAMTTFGRPRTRDHRTQLNGEIDKELVADFNAIWRRSGRKRWEVLQDVVTYGLAEYKRREAETPSALDLLGRTG